MLLRHRSVSNLLAAASFCDRVTPAHIAPLATFTVKYYTELLESGEYAQTILPRMCECLLSSGVAGMVSGPTTASAPISAHLTLMHIADAIAAHHRSRPRNVAVACRTGVDPAVVTTDAGAAIVRVVSDLGLRFDDAQRTILSAISELATRVEQNETVQY